ncbi:unnamed protein product [Meganyctiphanes norvegica]|uniref:Tetraspanin n=1 Tax=Meganyctiphanes norvegica TaxID=48144 RepID=A0AAV2RT50_MEGNR
MGGCCYGCLKYMVMIFNLIYMLMGGALLGTVLWMYLDGLNFTTIASKMDDYTYVLIFLMALGAIMTIMGFLGCCGALQESQCMLATFFALVLVILAGQIAACVFFFANQEVFMSEFKKTLKESLVEHYGNDEIKTRAFDGIQKELKCCGVSGPHDWKDSRYNNAEGKSSIEIGVSGALGIYNVPNSCCSTTDPNACEAARKLTISSPLFSDALYRTGCADQAIKFLRSHGLEVLIIVALIVLIELLAMVFSMVLCCAVRRIDQFKA